MKQVETGFLIWHMCQRQRLVHDGTSYRKLPLITLCHESPPALLAICDINHRGPMDSLTNGMGLGFWCFLSSSYRSWTSCQIRTIAGGDAPGTFSPRSRHASRHVRHAVPFEVSLGGGGGGGGGGHSRWIRNSRVFNSFWIVRQEHCETYSARAYPKQWLMIHKSDSITIIRH